MNLSFNERVQKGPKEREKVFNELYSDVFSHVKQFVLRNSGILQDAEDVFQEAIVVLFKRALDPLKEEIEDPKPFVLAVCRNLWYSKATRMARISLKEELPEVEVKLTPFENIANEERKTIIGETLNALGEVCSKLLNLSILEGRSMKEISKLMNFANENTAKTKNYKCKQRLIALVKDDTNFRNILRNG